MIFANKQKILTSSKVQFSMYKYSVMVAMSLIFIKEATIVMIVAPVVLVLPIV